MQLLGPQQMLETATIHSGLGMADSGSQQSDPQGRLDVHTSFTN